MAVFKDCNVWWISQIEALNGEGFDWEKIEIDKNGSRRG